MWRSSKPRLHAMAPASKPAAERSRPGPGDGFTYIGLLIFIALMGIALSGIGSLWHTHAQREKERQLLFVGDQFRQAIGRYYELSPGGEKRYPLTLDDLLLDERYPATQRYLRRIYPDPLTGKAEWGIVTGPEERIAGVYSLSDAAPFKRAGFPAGYEDFEDKEHYREWRFIYIPPAPSAPPQ